MIMAISWLLSELILQRFWPFFIFTFNGDLGLRYYLNNQAGMIKKFVAFNVSVFVKFPTKNMNYFCYFVQKPIL